MESRISSLSSNEDAFRNAAPPYDEALKNSGYNHNIKYREIEQEKEKNEKKKKKNRGRNITWFNPPFSGNVQTNVGRKFLLLVSKHFPAGHKLHQIFNKNTIKVSYSCMKNINTVIKNHNDRIIRRFKGSTETEKESRCNCRQKGECPLQGSCLEKAIVYRATVTSPDGRKEYYGSTGGAFKDRYANHKKSLKHEKYQNETELSKYIWKLKTKGTNYELKWKIMKKSNVMKRRSGICNLCLEEKYSIFMNKHALNKRSELITKCRHSGPFDRGKRTSAHHVRKSNKPLGHQTA